jgi:hypothetical protein
MDKPRAFVEMSHPELCAMEFPFKIGVIIDGLKGMRHHCN